MKKNTLIIKEAEIVNGELLIKKLAIIDRVTGEELRISKINEQLKNFLMSIEIDLDAYLHIEKMKEENPNYKHLINKFNLVKL